MYSLIIFLRNLTYLSILTTNLF